MSSTREHGQIQHWAEQHGAHPAQIYPRKFDGEPAVLTFVFGILDAAREDIAVISWEAFFALFDLLELSMAFDDVAPGFTIAKTQAPPGLMSN